MEFVEIFTLMSPWTWSLIILGFVFMLIEFFIPGFGICGIIGSVCLLAAVIVRGVVDGGEILQVSILALILIVICVLFWVVLVISAKRGLLSKTPIILSGTAVSVDYATIKQEELDLLGAEAVLNTDAKPLGKAKFNNKEIEVYAREGFLVKGTEIRVVEVTTEKIVVEKIKGGKIK